MSGGRMVMVGLGARGLAVALVVLSAVGPVAAATTQETVAPAAGQELPVMSLAQCVKLALVDSPSLEIARQQRGMAAQDVRGAWGAFLPSLTLSYNWQKSERTDYDVAQTEFGTYPMTTVGGDTLLFPTQVATGAVMDETNSSKYKSLTARAQLNVFDGFAKYGTLSSARHGLEAADASTGYAHERVIESVIAAYFNLVRYQELARVARDSRDQAAKELERMDTYFRLGSAAKSDVLQQRVQLENTKLAVVVADNNIQQGIANLAYAMNRPLAASFAVDGGVLATDFEVEEVATMYDEALRNRLDLQSSERNVEARRGDARAVAGGLLPRVDLFGNYNRDNNESPYKFGAQIASSTSYGASVSWNVFDRMQTITGVSKAKAGVRIAEYQLQQARMNAQVEIRQLHNALVEARERASLSRETIIQAEEGLRLAQERFRVGAGTALDVVVAQVNLATARSQEVQAKCDFLIARASLDRAVGRASALAAN